MRSLAHILIALAAAGTAQGQTTYFEIEPNDSKAQATVVSGLTDGDTIAGTVPLDALGVRDVDYFLVSTAPLPPGIYHHFLYPPGRDWPVAVRGMTQIDPGPGLPGVIQFGTDVGITSDPFGFGAISNDWFGFGKAEKLYVNVGEASSIWVEPCCDEYQATLLTIPVTPVDIGPFQAGELNLTFSIGFGEIHVFDSSFVAIPDALHTVEPDFATGSTSGGLTRSFAAGTYYVAVAPLLGFDSSGTLATHLASPADDPFGKDDVVLDFAGAVVHQGGGVIAIGHPLQVSDAAGVRLFPVQGTVAWFRMTVVGDGACDPVSIVSAPSDASVCDGHEALFEVVAGGSGPLEYQWSGPAGPIPGATSSMLLLSGVTFADAGLYEVTITNGCSQQVASATLDVHPAGPDITQHPEPAGPLCPGQVAIFTVSAHGHMGGALSYQWYKDCTPISGATADTLEVLVAGIEDQGQYKVRVTEAGCGSADSFPAMLYVSNDPPQITLNGDAYMVLECCRDSYVEPGAQVSDDCDSGLVATITGSVNTHKPGNYELKYDVTDSQGNAAATVSRWVMVVDTTPPEVLMTVTDPILWSPNHEMVNVGLLASATDLCDPAGAADSLQIMVFCDETELPDTGDGTGKHAPDAKDIGAGTLRLRSERRGKEDGRVYIIMATATDASGNIGMSFASAVCPKSSDAGDVALVTDDALTTLAVLSGLVTDGSAPAMVLQTLADLGFQLHGVEAEQGPHQ